MISRKHMLMCMLALFCIFPSIEAEETTGTTCTEALRTRSQAPHEPPLSIVGVPPQALPIQVYKGSFLWPMEGQISARFRAPCMGECVAYKGMDIRAPRGTPFYAVWSGRVVYADYFNGYGNLIIIEHSKTHYSLYAHAHEITVETEDVVSQCQRLGTVGATDSLKEPHLYFEIRVDAIPVNPEKWLVRRDQSESEQKEGVQREK